MLSQLKNHPFGVNAYFDHSLVLTYALPKERLQALLPPCFAVDSFKDKWGFVALAVVKTNRLRPAGFPAFAGQDFVLVGYRIFVRYTTTQGKRLRGLYILKSETDNRLMTTLGSVFTRYRYTTTDVHLERNENRLCAKSEASGLYVLVEAGNENVPLPPGSPFGSWKEARRFAGPLPFTFSFDKEKNEVLLVEGQREDWSPQPVCVHRADVGFLRKAGFDDAVLANAFLVQNVSYHWKKGRIEKWKP